MSNSFAKPKTPVLTTFKVLTIIAIFFVSISLVVTISIYGIVNSVGESSSDGKVKSILGYKPLVVESESMQPTFMVGDLIFVKDISKNDILKPQDIISYRYNINDCSIIITHRIIETGVDDNGVPYFITRGDNSSYISEHVTYDMVEGVYNGNKIAGVGPYVHLLQSYTGRIIFVLVIVFLFIILVSLIIMLIIFNVASKKKIKKMMMANNTPVGSYGQQMSPPNIYQ